MPQKAALSFFISVALTLCAYAQKPELVVDTGHGRRVYALAFSPDGRLLASGSGDATVKLWELETGRELRTLIGHTLDVVSVAFSPDGRLLASASSDGMIKLWDVAGGRELRTVVTYTPFASAVAFSPDGKYLATRGGNLQLWDIAAGRALWTAETVTDTIAFSPDGKLIATAGLDGSFDYAHPDRAKFSVKLWEAATGREVRVLPCPNGVLSPAFSPDGHLLAAATGSNLQIWDPNTGRIVRTFTAHAGGVEAVAFSPGGTLIATASRDGTVKLWDPSTGQPVRTMAGAHGDFVNSLAFHPSGRFLASVTTDEPYAATLWAVDSGRNLGSLTGFIHPILSFAFSADGRLWASARDGKTTQLWALGGRGLTTLSAHADHVNSAWFSADGRVLASGSNEGVVKIWNVKSGREFPPQPAIYINDAFALSPDGRYSASVSKQDSKTFTVSDVATGRPLRTFSGHATDVASISFSSDGRLLASHSKTEIKLWDVAGGRPLRTFAVDGTPSDAPMAFSPDGHRLVSSSGYGSELNLWDLDTGRERTVMTGDTLSIQSLAYSPDGRLLASASWDGTLKVWDADTAREIRSLAGHAGLDSVAFSPDGRFLLALDQPGSLLLWDVATGNELVRIILLGERDWAVVDPKGRFDATPPAMDLMHWTVGTETIALSQLKDRYYEPGLLGKVLGFNQEPVRNVNGFSEIKLFPEVDYADPAPDAAKLEIHLKNRGGGLGRTQVLVNGKELRADARGPGVDPNAEEATINVDLSAAHIQPGEENKIEIVAWNREGYLSSRGVTILWKPAGVSDKSPPEFYAIVSGISDYASADFRLRFAAKDAQDMARALRLGATRLFGPERVHITLLTSDTVPGAQRPTKANIEKAFEAAQKSKPGDLFIVYLAGHGVAIQDTYAYPTEEARTLDLTDPVLRSRTSITSEELVDWIKKVPASHQAMILDTCAAGAAQKSLMESRDIPSDQVRALDRLKSRTGFFVLMGSAADAASYEASEYDQGLLTYSLLQGMRGAALREEKYIDVSKLFGYSADQVPQLARNVRGVQQPLVLAPLASASFDIGELESDDRRAIPLAAVKPMVLRPILLNRAEDVDTLELSAALRSQLRTESYINRRGLPTEVRAVFVDEEDFPGAIRPTGSYTVTGDQVKVRLILTRDGKKIAEMQIDGSVTEKESLVKSILAALVQAVAPVP